MCAFVCEYVLGPQSLQSAHTSHTYMRTQAEHTALQADHKGLQEELSATKRGEEMWNSKYVTLLEK